MDQEHPSGIMLVISYKKSLNLNPICKIHKKSLFCLVKSLNFIRFVPSMINHHTSILELYLRFVILPNFLNNPEKWGHPAVST